MVNSMVNSMKPCANAPMDKNCDVCGSGKAVIDGPTHRGSWAYMCPECIKTTAKTGWQKVGFKLIVEKL